MVIGDLVVSHVSVSAEACLSPAWDFFDLFTSNWPIDLSLSISKTGKTSL